MNIAGLFVTILLLASACKEVAGVIADDSPAVETKIEEGYLKAFATNQYGDEGCGWVLYSEEVGLLMPIDLEEKYKQEGLEMLVKYRPSRVQQETCFNAKPILIDEILLIEKTKK